MACTTLVEGGQISTEKPIEGLVLKNITGTCAKGIVLQNVKDAVLSGLAVTGYQGALLTLTNVQGVGLEEPK